MKNFLRFLKFYSPYKWNVLIGIFLSLITTFAGIFLLAISGWFIAAMGIAGAASLSMNYFTPAAMIRGLAILRTTGRYGERIANHDAALRVTSEFREWFFNRLEPLAPEGLSDLHSADMFSRLRGDIDIMERFYLNGLIPLLTAIIGFLILAVGLANYHLPLALLEVSLLLLAGFFVPIIMRRGAKHDEAAIAQARTNLNVDLSEMMHGMGEYLVYGRVNQQISQIQQQDIKISHARNKINKRESFIHAVILFCGGLAVVGAIYLMVPLLSVGSRAPAELAMMVLFCLACFDIISPLPIAIQSLHAAHMASNRIFDIADRPVRDFLYSRSNIDKVKDANVLLSVENVSFSYTTASVLRNVSFNLSEGEVMVLAGRSGSGKSTMLEILLGFHSGYTGNISLKDMNADSFDEEIPRNYFSLAPQKPYYFADTLLANLILANPNASIESIQEICRVSGLQEVIEKMPKGLETYLGEHGVRLSGGQLRRVAIARSLLKRSPILLLDEPVEGLEFTLENTVMRSVLAFAKKRRQAVILCLHEGRKEWLPEDTKVFNL